ncbi:TIGR01212 family radical SAM protein [candidate division WOR-3 bacterium]|nr:TIGR01212 family radical SAM protein [candidate division WOR-3 bacterium]
MEYYNSFNEHLKEQFGYKVYKVPVSIGASCPNRTSKEKGCTYCDSTASASPIIDNTLPLSEQIRRGIKWAEKKYKAKGFIVYFQPFTNTFLPLNYLKESIDTALQTEHVVGIAIGTRPDCAPDEMLDLLASYAKQTYLWIEYGLQSVHYKTLKVIKRGHSFADFLDAVQRTKKRENILVSTHIIIGLPGETRDDIVETSRVISTLLLDGIKIHLLHILKGSELAIDYREGRFNVLTLEEYASLVVDFIERLPQNILIQRVTGEAEKKRLVAPLWCLDKQKVLKRINEEFEMRKTHQGAKVKYGLSMSEIERRTLDGIASKLG